MLSLRLLLCWTTAHRPTASTPAECCFMAAEEAQIEALLASAGMRTAPPPEAAGARRVLEEDTICRRRDVLVLDAALGGAGSWDVRLARSEVDYVEERPEGWAASVSVVASLQLLDPTAESAHMHDETGSGRADAQPTADDATAVAEGRALESARRRLAKRFATSLDTQLLAVIERQANPKRPPGRGPAHGVHASRRAECVG
jgi:hypothetical protein